MAGRPLDHAPKAAKLARHPRELHCAGRVGYDVTPQDQNQLDARHSDREQAKVAQTPRSRSRADQHVVSGCEE
eukprot:3996595-Pyramimonas_sp.AAC.1